MISYCYSLLFGLNGIFQLISSGLSILWYGYRYRATLCTGQLHPITVCRTVVLGVRWSCVECHYVFLLLIPTQSAISSWWLRLLLGFYVHCIYSELHLMLFETRLLWFYNNVPPLDVSSPGYYRWIMMTSSNGIFFPRYWPFVQGIHRSPGEFPHKGQWRGALKFSLICARINGWVNNREVGDLRRHKAHCDVIVMKLSRTRYLRTPSCHV